MTTMKAAEKARRRFEKWFNKDCKTPRERDLVKEAAADIGELFADMVTEHDRWRSRAHALARQLNDAARSIDPPIAELFDALDRLPGGMLHDESGYWESVDKAIDQPQAKL